MQLGETLRSDDQGRFAFDSLPADTHFDVFTPSYSRLFNIPLELDSDDPVTVTLESPASVRGVVVDAKAAKPIRQFRMRVGLSQSRKATDPDGTFDGQWSNPGLTFNANDGRFVVGPLISGLPVELTVEAEGYERQVVSRAIAAKEGEGEELRVSLKRVEPAQLFTLKGQLLDFAGKPASGAATAHRVFRSADRPKR